MLLGFYKEWFSEAALEAPLKRTIIMHLAGKNKSRCHCIFFKNWENDTGNVKKYSAVIDAIQSVRVTIANCCSIKT